jgi:hypothetical protein
MKIETAEALYKVLKTQENAFKILAMECDKNNKNVQAEIINVHEAVEELKKQLKKEVKGKKTK